MTENTRTTLRPSEVAKKWGCKVQTILKLIHAGELDALNVAIDLEGFPRWKVPVAAVEAFEKSRMNRTRG